MIQPEEHVIKSFAHIAQNVPAVKEYINAWAEMELKRLPHATNNTAVAQGRCQVLEELKNLINGSPDFSAQLRDKQPTNNNAYR